MLFQSLLYCSNSCTSLHFKTLNSQTKTLKIRPKMFRSPLKPSSGGPWPYFAMLLNWNVDLLIWLYNYFFLVCHCDPTRDMASSCLRFPDHTHNDAPQSVGLLWTSNQLVAETSTWQHTTLTTDKHPCPPVGFEPTISAGERLQTYALDRAATGTGR